MVPNPGPLHFSNNAPAPRSPLDVQSILLSTAVSDDACGVTKSFPQGNAQIRRRRDGWRRLSLTTLNLVWIILLQSGHVKDGMTPQKMR